METWHVDKRCRALFVLNHVVDEFHTWEDRACDRDQELRQWAFLGVDLASDAQEMSVHNATLGEGEHAIEGPLLPQHL